MLSKIVFITPLMALVQVPATPVDREVTETNRQVIKEAFDRWQNGGTSFFDEVIAPDVVWTVEGSSRYSGTFRGREDFTMRAVRPLAIRLAEPVRPVSKRIWADGDHVIIDWVGTAVARDGHPYRNSYVWIFRMLNGKVVEAKATLDMAQYDRVITRVPAPPAKADAKHLRARPGTRPSK